jgi:arsenite transporter
MIHVLSYLQKRLFIFIPVFMALGVITGRLTDVSWLRSTILPITLVMVYPMMVNFRPGKIFERGDGKLQLAAQLVNFILLPLLGLVIGAIFFKTRPVYAAGIFLMALIPTSGMTISWTGFAGGNVNAAVKMTIIGLLLGAIASPFYMKIFMGTAINVKILTMARQIGLVIFVPMVLGNLTRLLIVKRKGSEEFNKNIKKKFPPISAAGVLAIVFVAMALKSSTILNHPEELLRILPPILLFYGAAYILTFFTGRIFFSKDDGTALVFGTVMRNLSIALALAMTTFREDGATIALIIALAYIVQVQSAAWFVKLLTRSRAPSYTRPSSSSNTERTQNPAG